MIDDLTALRLQLEWGADEAIAEAASDRFHGETQAPARRLPSPAPVPAAPPPLGLPARARDAASAAPDLATLRASLEAFDGCGLRDTAGSLVFADGPADARLLVVVEAPDAADDESGRPLSGEAGRLFDRMLFAAGIDRAACRVVCLVPWRPPGGRPPNAGEVAACAPFLERHLALLAVDHAILFGACVARTLLGVSGTIRQFRGTWHALPGNTLASSVQALVMVPPAQIITDPKSRKSSWSDLLMLRERTGPISSAKDALSGLK